MGLVVILFFVDRASLYNLVNKTNLMHNSFLLRIEINIQRRNCAAGWFSSRRGKATRNCRQLHIQDLCVVYSLPLLLW
jgi:hypothetical protein